MRARLVGLAYGTVAGFLIGWVVAGMLLLATL